MRHSTRTLVLLTLLTLSVAGCGMNRAVGVLPQTLDDLEREVAGEAPPG